MAASSSPAFLPVDEQLVALRKGVVDLLVEAGVELTRTALERLRPFRGVRRAHALDVLRERLARGGHAVLAALIEEALTARDVVRPRARTRRRRDGPVEVRIRVGDEVVRVLVCRRPPRAYRDEEDAEQRSSEREVQVASRSGR